MRIRSLILASLSVLAMTSGSFAAIVGCKDYVEVTPNNAARPYSATVSAGSNGSLGGTAYTKATFCPAAAAAGTCTGESLSEKVNSYVGKFVAFDGNVDDIYTHRKTLLGIPVGPVLDGACGS